MSKFLSKLLLVVAIYGVSAEAGMAKAVLDVGLNRAELVTLNKPMTEVMISNPEVADVVVHGSQKISVIGKKIGSTNLRFFDDKANLINEVDIVVGYDLPAIRRTLKRFFPQQNLGLETINNSLAVSGVVPDAQTANRVMQIVYEFVKETRRDDASGGAGQRYTEQDNRFPGIVNLMTLNSGQQVMLKVRIGELQRTAARNLGFNLQALNNSGDSIFQFATGSGQELFNTAGSGLVGQFGDLTTGSFVSAGGAITRGNFSGAALFEALEQDGLFKIIAEPNLTAVSGETANFLAGGEFPVAAVTTDGAVDITFKQFGVSLAFTPYVLANNRIRLTVAPELSEISSVAEGGVAEGIPSLSTRRAKTTIELAPGESFMVAGLIRDRINTNINEVPGIAEIPIISALMRSSSYAREESELVIAVTPYIVDPVVNSDIRLPTDEFRTPSVMEMFFYGALGSLSGNSDRIGQTPVLEGPIGFMMD